MSTTITGRWDAPGTVPRTDAGGTRSTLGAIAATWAIAGVVLLLGAAIVRLAPVAAHVLEVRLTTTQLLALAAWIVVMAYAEGYRGFQKAFSPRVAARARHLAEHPTLLRALLAPLFVMAYFGAPPRRRVVSFVVTAAIVGLVVAVRQVPQPWRAILDAGVVVGLTWGLVTLLVFTARAFGSRGLDHPPEVA